MFKKLVRFRTTLSIIVFFVGVSQPVRAGAQAEPAAAAPVDRTMAQQRPLTIEDAVRLALEIHPNIRAAQDDISAATEATGEARASYYPNADFVAGYNRWQRHALLPSGIAPPGISTVIGPTDDWFAGVRTRYMLFDSGQRRGELQAALARAGAAKEEAVRVRNDIALLVHQAYFALRAAQELESVTREQVARAEDHLRLAIARKEAGAVPQADVVRAQVGVADARMSLEKAESDIRIAKGNLNASMGLSAEMPIEIDSTPRNVTPPEAIPIDEALDTAVRNRPEIRTARERVSAAGKDVDSARSASGLKIRAEGYYGWRDENFAPRDQDWSAGISLELPIFTGFANRHRLGRAKADLSREQAGLEALAVSVRRDIWAAHSSLREAYARVRSAEPLVRDAEEGLRLASERYDAGAGTMTDLLDSEAALARAEGVRTEAQLSYQVARSAFLHSTGQLLAP